MKKIIAVIISLVLIGLVIASDVGLSLSKPDLSSDLTSDEKTWATSNYGSSKATWNYWYEGDKLMAKIYIGDNNYYATITTNFDETKTKCEITYSDDEQLIATETCITLTEDEMVENWVIKRIQKEYSEKDVTAPSQNKTEDWNK